MKTKLLATLLLCVAPALFAADGAKALRGTVETIDLKEEAIAVKTPDGIFYSVTVTETVDLEGAKRGNLLLRGLKKGSNVVVVGTVTGGKVAAEGLYVVGKGGLEVGTATVKGVAEGGRILVVTTEKGAEVTYHISSKAVTETAKGVTAGTKVVLYSSAKGGKKVAHFFEAVV